MIYFRNKIKGLNKIGILFFGVFIISCKNHFNVKPVNNKKDNYQYIINSIYKSNPKSIGIMVHIESPKKDISWSGSIGYSDKENKTILLPNQPALIASSIKTYVAATILRLQEEGKLSIEDSIDKYLTSTTCNLFKSDGYDLKAIKIKHLLSHTSGIQDYVNEEYLNKIDKNKQYRWTRNEQLKLATKVGNPLGKPQEVFSYADVNYLLCTEIMEQIIGKPFYEVIREFLKYKQLNVANTWFPTLEKKPLQTKELVHQYWSKKDWDSCNIDISYDLYGGGGIATTTKELAQFSYNLFNKKIIEDEDILKLLSTKINTFENKGINYALGLSIGEVKGFKSYGHGGFWGTTVLYFPKLDTSISVFVLERSVKGDVIKQVLEDLVSVLAN